MAPSCLCWTSGPQCCRYQQRRVAHYWCSWCQNRGCPRCAPFWRGEEYFTDYMPTIPWTYKPRIYTDSQTLTDGSEYDTVEIEEEERPLRADDI